MKFNILADYLEKLEKTASRIEITKILAEIFKKSEKWEIDKVTYLLLGTLAPSYKSIVFNLAERMMLDVLSEAYGVDKPKVREVYKKNGDLGLAAASIAQRKESKAQIINLSVLDVYNKLLVVAQDEGEGSQERKIQKMADLLKIISPLSAKFVARIPVGKLRLGFSDKTVLDALSWMESGSKEKKAVLETAYNILPDVGLLAKKVIEEGVDKTVSYISPEIGIPMLPMLAQRLKSPVDMIKKMKRVFVEPKFDGLRIQIHYRKKGFENGSLVKVFTRNLNETSWMFPELKKIGNFVKVDEAIFDSEAMGVNEELKTLANFQTTMTRRRKHDIEKIASKLAIKFYVFDMMYKDGKSLVGLPYEDRRKILSESITNGNLLQVVEYEITESSEKINELMRQELREGMEGIIVKRADSKYVAGRTGWRWVKIKEAENASAKLADTLDLIVMGYTRSKGKRAKFGIGQFLVGIREESGKFLTVTKIGTGLTDLQFEEMKRRLSKLQIQKKPKSYDVHKDLEPDYWVEPSLVVEIAADEITKSPKHTSGFALRFPRLIKFRDDKSPNEATTVAEVKKLYKLQ